MLARIVRDGAIACIAMALFFAAWNRSVMAGVAVLGGGLLIGFSLWAIRSAVDDLVGRPGAETGRKAATFALVKFFTRHGIVALAAYGMMVRLRIDPVGLLAGVSSLGVATAVEVLRDLRWRRFP